MNYNEALEYIHSVMWKGSRPGLSRITELAELLGNPEKATKYIHVAGTNGKGSTSAMLASVLLEAGFKVGLFTSPYIEFFNERIRFMGENISDEDLAEVTAYIKPFADSMEDSPTEFELITAIAFEYYRRVGCDIVVLETGMGGRLDSTNIIESPLVSIITNIGLDHVAYLGNTIEKIALEKAGIIKKTCPVLFGGNDEISSKVISDIAKAKNSAYFEVDYSALKINSANFTGLNFDFKEYKSVKLSLIGLYQAQNTALVLTAIDILKENGMEISNTAIYEGLAKAKWKGRFEVLSQNPLFIIDGSHNSHGIHAAIESIKYYCKDEKIILLSGVMEDKDYTKMVEELALLVDVVHTITPNNPRALSAEDYAKAYLNAGVKAYSHPTIREAVVFAMKDAKEKSLPIIALGSLYMYTDVKRELIQIIEE